MPAWVETKGLQHLLAQINDWAPDRDKTSDGEIGDAAHQKEKSGHNPDITGNAEYKDGDNLNEVRALDVDSDLRMPGISMQTMVDHIRALPNVSSRLRYIIYNEVIYEASNGWRGRPYTGPSQHKEHAHFSGAYTQAADNDSPPFDYRLEDIPVALTAADKTWLAAQIGAAFKMSKQADGTPTSPAGNAILSQGIPDGTDPKGARQDAWEVIQNLGKAIRALDAKVSALTPKD